MLASRSLRRKLQRLEKPRSLEVRSCYWGSSKFHTAPGVFLASKELKLQRHDTHSGIVIVGSDNMRAGEGLSGAGLFLRATTVPPQFVKLTDQVSTSE